MIAKSGSSWWQERLGLKALDYEVPGHANTLLYSLGGITSAGVLILAVTGLLMTQFYRVDMANQSVRAIMGNPWLGYVRGLHYWTAQVVILTLLLHLLRVVVTGSYRKPRELQWYVGVALFGVMAGLFFTGTVVKWDQESIEALEHAKEAAGLLGPMGAYFTGATAKAVGDLPRFFSLHVSVLPALLVLLFAIHALLIKALKISPLPMVTAQEDQSHSQSCQTGTAEPEKHYFSQHLGSLAGYGLIFFGLVSLLAVFLPPVERALPVAGIEATRPPWAFMGLFNLENWFEIKGLVVASFIILAVLLLVPVLDRARTHLLRDRKGMLAATAVATLIFLGLTVNSYLAKPATHLMGEGEATAAPGSEPATPAMPSAGATSTTPGAGTSGPSPLVTDLKTAQSIVHAIENALKAKDLAQAGELAGKLDEQFDGLSPKLSQYGELVEPLEGNIHKLGQQLKAGDASGAATTLDAVDGGVDSLLDKVQG